ncbi:hypothetical protein R70199_08057 [Paraburkholderia domus]|nr:hypothetical protein R70199_08057 [Paraburkholderia domus]
MCVFENAGNCCQHTDDETGDCADSSIATFAPEE